MRISLLNYQSPLPRFLTFSRTFGFFNPSFSTTFPAYFFPVRTLVNS